MIREAFGGICTEQRPLCCNPIVGELAALAIRVSLLRQFMLCGCLVRTCSAVCVVNMPVVSDHILPRQAKDDEDIRAFAGIGADQWLCC